MGTTVYYGVFRFKTKFKDFLFFKLYILLCLRDLYSESTPKSPLKYIGSLKRCEISKREKCKEKSEICFLHPKHHNIQRFPCATKSFTF